MCSPALFGLGIGIASSVSGFASGKTRQDAMNFMADQDLEYTNEALDAQQEEINAKSADEMSDRARAALVERGRLRAIAAESGISGVSQDLVERESAFNEGFDLATLDSNRRSALVQNKRDRTAARLDARRAKLGIQGPSLLGTGLQIAGKAAEYSATKDKTSTKGK